jgi:hypothetical protein
MRGVGSQGVRRRTTSADFWARHQRPILVKEKYRQSTLKRVRAYGRFCIRRRPERT